MKLLEDIFLEDSIEIKVPPEKVFDFLVHIVDDESYRTWHPDDHVAFLWIKGQPWTEGSAASAEEYIHGKLHRLKFLVTRVVPNREIEFVPLSRLLRIYAPGNTFTIEPKGDGCVFTAAGSLRIGRIAKVFAKDRIERALSSVKKHMKEEGENLKRILESQEIKKIVK
jgi:hypothetical protein